MKTIIYKAIIPSMFSGLLLTIQAETVYVNNITGKDTNPGRSMEMPVASIEKAFAIVKPSDQVDIANTGKPYSKTYPGQTARPLVPRCGGSIDRPMVINGNGAVISGLAAIPAAKWQKETNRLYSFFFYPMSNLYKRELKENRWLDGTQIWWVNGQAAPNCPGKKELEKTPGGFWWNKAEKKVFFHVPEGKKIESLKIELPANSGICIQADHTVVKNLKVMFSWNDGFDIAGSPKNVIYKNCLSYNNCGQGFSCHDTGNAYYEDCAAIRCASSGSCDVHWSNSTYRRCLFINNTYEAGIFAEDDSIHNYDDCLIVKNRPFEQIWQSGHAKMNFVNCVIVGGSDDKPILRLAGGSVLFKNCTIVNAGTVGSLPENSACTLSTDNCVFARCTGPFFNLPPNAKSRVFLTGNIYIDGPGNRFNKKIYGGKDWPDYLKLQIETNSEWRNFKLAGPLNTELPEPVILKGRFGSSAVGARLPKEVWDQYFKLLREVPTPAGITEN